MRCRPILAVALATAVAFGPWAHAAEPAPQVTDPASDANFLNDNSPLVINGAPDNPANNNPTPVGSESAADIVSILYKTTKKKGAVTGFTVTMTTTAAPTKSDILFRATAETADCGTLWFQYYTSDPKTTPQTSLRHTCDGAGSPAVVPMPAFVVGNSIIWIFTFADKNAPKVVKKGTEIIKMGGHARPYVSNTTCVPGTSGGPDPTRCTTNPVQYDTTNNFPGPYKVGS